jgi:DNA-binding NtrC family response regulator
MAGPTDTSPDAPTAFRRFASRARSLTVIHSSDSSILGRVYPIGDGLCIGRQSQPGVDIAVDDRLLSRRHASIQPLGSSSVHELIDHDSRNGSFVDGVRVQRSHLSEGSIVRLGVTLFELTRDTGENIQTDAPPLGGQRDAFVGRSVAFRELLEALDEAAKNSDPVVITGEPGAGKTAATSYLHKKQHPDASMVTVSCGSGPKLRLVDLFGGKDDAAGDAPLDGFLTSAAGGTLVLDEVDLLEPELQKALLDLLRTKRYKPVGSDEERELKARVVATTCANLDAAVDAGVFDRELHEALAVHSIDVPALRSRRCDVPLMAQHFLRLEEPGRRFDWSATFLEKLLLYDWPMNVRELRTVMRRLTMVEEEITTLRSAHLPKDIRRRVRMPSEDALRASAIQVHVVPSRQELQEMLERHRGDVQQVADHYAKDRRHVYKWLSRHDLSVSDYRKT